MWHNRVLWSLILVLLGTWPHFSDPPSGFTRTAGRDDPQLGFSFRLWTRDFSFCLVLFLRLYLFVMLLVFLLAVIGDVILFVFCYVSACKWRLLWTYGRTYFLLVLLAGDVIQSRPEYRYRSASMRTRTTIHDAAPLPEMRDFTIKASFTDVQNMEHRGIHSLLLDMIMVSR